MKSKKFRTIRKQILMPVTVFMIVFLILDSALLYIYTSSYVTRNQYENTDMLATNAVLEMEKYSSLSWLIDYWESHYNEMDFVYGDPKLLEEKDRTLRESHPEILEYKDVTSDMAESMSDADQKLFAEICYALLSSDFDRIKQSQKPLYLYSFRIRKKSEMFILVTGTKDEEKRISDGGELFELGVINDYQEGVYPVLDEVANTGRPVNGLEKSKEVGADHTAVHTFRPVYSNGKMVAIIGVALNSRNLYIMGYKMSAVMILISALLFIISGLVMIVLLNRIVIKPIRNEQKIIEKYEQDKEPEAVKGSLSKLKTNNELRRLAESFASMVTELDRYMEEIKSVTAEKERIGTELALATRIQADMLPNIYPAFPERPEFDIYATMTPAKEVGGDFYDFFLIDDDHLCMVMADVSGKGVPAALFMMASKIILANNAMIGKSPAQILADTNAAICANNREEMFVTVWLGILEISTGSLTAANAGHEYPAIRYADGSFELYKDKHGFVIGGMDGVKYKEYDLKLTPGARLFVYTDGVAEATNAENELFGTERMIKALNVNPTAKPKEILDNVRCAVDGFVKEAEQFDDLTMLCMEYLGPVKEKEDSADGE